MKFGEALEHLREGRSVCREGWDDYARLVLVPGSTFMVTSDRPVGRALPDLLGHDVRYEPHIDVVDRDTRMRAWTPTQADVLAEDWALVEGAS